MRQGRARFQPVCLSALASDRPLEHPNMTKILSIPKEEHAAMIGRVAVAWNDVQFAVSQIFWLLSGMPQKRAHAVFFALRTDAAQRDITNAAALDVLSDDNALYKRLAK